MGDDFDEIERDVWHEDGEDAYVTDARGELLKLINARPQEVFYERQLQVFFENQFYHWVTSKALDELAEDREVQSGFRPLTRYGGGAAKARFFFSTQLRYWTRKANEASSSFQSILIQSLPGPSEDRPRCSLTRD